MNGAGGPILVFFNNIIRNKWAPVSELVGTEA